MESKAKFLGHAIHPMLVVFPLGLLIMALVFDIVYLTTRNATFATVAYWDIAAGIIGGLLAAVFGFVDWLAIPVGTRAKAIGAWHGGGNFVVIVLFGASWLLRYAAPGHAPSTLAFLLGLAAVVLGAVTGWLGGELVEQLGVGVNPEANLDAPNSLARNPKDEGAGDTQRSA